MLAHRDQRVLNGRWLTNLAHIRHRRGETARIKGRSRVATLQGFTLHRVLDWRHLHVLLLAEAEYLTLVGYSELDGCRRFDSR